MKKSILILSFSMFFTPIIAETLFSLKEIHGSCYVEGQKTSITGKVISVHDPKTKKSAPMIMIKSQPCYFEKKVGNIYFIEGKAFNLIRIRGVNFHVLPVKARLHGVIEAKKAKNGNNISLLSLKVKRWEQVK